MSTTAFAPQRLADEPHRLVGRRTELRRFPREIDLHENLERPRAGRPGRGAFVEPAQQIDRVDRVDGGEAGRRLARLVRLQVADEMPP